MGPVHAHASVAPSLFKCQTPLDEHGLRTCCTTPPSGTNGQFYNLLYNKFATSQCQSPTSRHVKMLGCGKFLSVGGEFVVRQVVELLWARRLVVLYNMFVAHVRVVKSGTKPTLVTVNRRNWTKQKHFNWCVHVYIMASSCVTSTELQEKRTTMGSCKRLWPFCPTEHLYCLFFVHIVLCVLWK